MSAQRVLQVSRMQLYQNEEFSHFYDQSSSAVFEGIEFRKCHFRNCGISLTNELSRRSKVRNVRFTNCRATNCSIGPAFLQDVVVDGLETGGGAGGMLLVKATALERVVLRGKIGKMLFTSLVPAGVPSNEVAHLLEKRFEEANREFYKRVDWALDISEAEFCDCDIRYVPARLIRRDPMTQVVVKREKVINSNWRSLDLEATPWAVSLRMMFERNWEDHVLIAPKRHPQFSQWLSGLYTLRRAGIAEPD